MLLTLVIAAHLDVVPANVDNWYNPPFDGIVQNGYIYGRGTIDDKHSVMVNMAKRSPNCCAIKTF